MARFSSPGSAGRGKVTQIAGAGSRYERFEGHEGRGLTMNSAGEFTIGRPTGPRRQGSPERTTTRGEGDDMVTTTTYQHRKYRGEVAIINAGKKPVETFVGDIKPGRGVNVGAAIRPAGPAGKVRRR